MFFFTDFNREGEWLLIGKIEADQGMGYFWPHPVGSDDVHASNLIQIKTPAFPTFDIATIGPPVKVADIVQSDLIALLLIIQKLGNLRIPLPILTRFQTEISKQTKQKGQKIKNAIDLAGDQMPGEINSENDQRKGQPESNQHQATDFADGQMNPEQQAEPQTRQNDE